MAKRTNSAVWMDKYQYWMIKVQKDSVRRSFYSSTPGRTGQREANKKADNWLDDSIVTGRLVRQHWAEYLDWAYPPVSGRPASSGRKNAVGIGENYILPMLGNMRIENITEGNLQTLLNVAYAKGSMKPKDKNAQHRPQSLPLSRKTLMNIRSDLVRFIKYCRRVAHVITLDPEGLTIPSGARYAQKNILQPESLKLLFSCDTTRTRGKPVFDDCIYAYRFQVACGLRPGELIGLQVGDVRPKTGEVRLQRSINIDGIETKGKNENAVRSLVMPDLAREAYDAQLQMMRRTGVEINYNTPLFQIMDEHAYYRRWTKYLKSNNLPHISLYELRHTFVSIAKFLPAGQVKPLVGHSKDMDTFGTYGHLLTGEAEKTAEDVSSIFDRIISHA